MLGRLVATLVLLLTCLSPGGAWASGLLEHERYTLDNGLDVVLHVDRTLPLVAVNLVYHVGSMHDGSHGGLAHVVEHLMFRGTADLGDGELRQRLIEAGAQGTNASTHHDFTSYHTVVPADQLPLALWLESNRMAYALPALDDGKFSEEIRTTIDEWEERIDGDRHGPSFEALWGTIFPPAHPFAVAPPEAIGRLRSHHARDFIRRHHGPANATLVLAGDLPPEVRELVGHYFGRREGGERPAEVSVAVSPPEREQRIVRKASLSATPLVMIAWPTPGLYEPGDAEADVLATTLNAERLEAMLEVEAPGLFGDIETRQLSRTGQSLFLIAAEGRASAQPVPMLEALDRVLAHLREEPLSAGDVRRARRRLATDALRGVQRLDQRASRMQMYVAAGKPPDWLDEDVARYEAVDEIAVAGFVREHLHPDRRVVVLALGAEESP